MAREIHVSCRRARARADVKIIITHAAIREIETEKMDDRVEREAALSALSSYEGEILRLCGECVEAMDAFEELNIITTDEKDAAYEDGGFTFAIAKLKEKITADPGFFVEFCRHIKKIEELSSIAATLLGEFMMKIFLS